MTGVSKRRTVAEKAQQNLDLAQRKLDRTMKRVVRLESELADANREADDLRADRDFWESHPALAEREEPVSPTG